MNQLFSVSKTIPSCHLLHRYINFVWIPAGFYFKPMKSTAIWNRAPFIRVLVPFCTGIVLQWYTKLPVSGLWTGLMITVPVLFLYFFLSHHRRFAYQWLNGLVLFAAFLCAGALLVWEKDMRNDPAWVGHWVGNDSSLVQLRLEEDPVEKTKSFKALATVLAIRNEDGDHTAKGKVILYFKKEEGVGALTYGTVLLAPLPLQEIKNAGNPGGFDYKRYCLFNGITHQLYLEAPRYLVLPGKKAKALRQFTLSLRSVLLSVLRRFIPSDKERGLAEALLIGYKDDLDKNLVQAYSNTGVVHVIAVSGLHLGLIYALLLFLLKPLRYKRHGKWMHLALVLAGLWLFSFLCGGSPSVLRSALMFTVIALAETLKRHSAVYNSLAVSAFVLLCFNPFWLWDVGFQLSYAAVLSIVLFMKPVYGLFYSKNKVIDFVWKLNAVTIAAQILTVPVSLYHFHQFPNYFLLTNFIAVPLSSVLLIGELLLCVCAVIPPLAVLLGKLLTALIWLMNTWIEKVEQLPFALWDGLELSLLQAFLLMAGIGSMAYAFLEKKKKDLLAGLTMFLVFVLLRAASFFQLAKQQQLIVYNVPKRQAMDFTQGLHYCFVGDPLLVQDEYTRNFHLRPTRIQQRLRPGKLPALYKAGSQLIQFGKKRIVILDSGYRFRRSDSLLQTDIIILSGNPKIYIKRLVQSFAPGLIVADGSNSAARLRYWKKDCDSLDIPFYAVQEKGAFVMQCR